MTSQEKINIKAKRIAKLRIENTYNTVFNGLLLSIIGILILMSLIAIIAVHWILFGQSFSFTPKGINNYLTALSEYKALFLATVSTIVAHFGLGRLKAATDANKDKLRQDRFTEWKTVLEVRTTEIEKFDPLMKREFVKVRYNLFMDLHNIHFSITDKEQLERIFRNHFVNFARFCDEMNEKHGKMGGVYRDKDFSYSFDSFQFSFFGCLDETYPNIYTDLKGLYLAALNPDRIIDMEMYRIALNNTITRS